MHVRSVIVRAVSVLTVVGAVLASTSSAAQAYSHNWNCNGGIAAYSQCYDTSGATYNPWTVASAGFGSPLPSGYTGFCLKAVTAAGNIKSGSNCFPSTDTLDSIFIAASPTSQAYYYFGGSGTSINNAGSAQT